MEELGASEAHKTEIPDYDVLRIQKVNSNFLHKYGYFGTIVCENLKFLTIKNTN